MQEHKQWLMLKESAAHQGVNQGTIYMWIDQRSMPDHKLGELWKLKISEVDEWVRMGSENEAESLEDSNGTA